MTNLKELFKRYETAPSSFFIGAMRLYQKTISPDHGMVGLFFRNARCRYYPSCSEYAIQAVSQYGLFKGSIASLKRLSRCHPFSHGGFDPVQPSIDFKRTA